MSRYPEAVSLHALLSVKLFRDRKLVLGLAGVPSQYFPGPLSLAIPQWVGAKSTGDGFGHRWGRTGKFCVAVGPATGTVGMLA